MPGHRRSPSGPVLLVVVAAISREVGAAFAVGLFAALGAIGAVCVRFLVAGSILAWRFGQGFAAPLGSVVFRRRTGRNLDGDEPLLLQLADPHPLGVTVTVEALGPLELSVVVSRRKTAWLWALLGLLGVALLGLTGVRVGHVDRVGLGFAAAAAASWAGYILATARAGSDFPKLDGLAIATAVGAMVTAPFAVVAVDPGNALAGRYSGLRRPPETFAILTCLSPVVAAVAGWLLLRQHLAVTGYVASVL